MNQISVDYLHSINAVYSGMETFVDYITGAKSISRLPTLMVQLDYIDPNGNLVPYTYIEGTNALDMANEVFATELLKIGANHSKVSEDSTFIEWIKQTGDSDIASGTMYSVASDATALLDFIDNYDYTDDETFISDFIIEIQENNCFSTFNNNVGKWMKEFFEVCSDYLGDKPSEITGDVLELSNIAEGLVKSLTIDQLRVCIVDDILSTQERGSLLYSGMKRLKTQMIENSVTKYLEEATTGYLQDKIIEVFFEHFVDPTKTFRSILNFANSLVFDMSLQVPDLDDIMTQTVLVEYASDLYNGLARQQGLFLKQFDTKEIDKYEMVAKAYFAISQKALDMSQQFLEPNNIVGVVHSAIYLPQLTEWISSDYNYDNYLQETKSNIIESIHNDEVMITYYPSWVCTEITTIKNSSDNTNDVDLYFLNWKFYGNVKIEDSLFSFPTDSPITINGNIVLESSTLYLSEDSQIHITGNFSKKGTSYSYLSNQGELVIDGNLSCNFLKMNDANAILKVRGNYAIQRIKSGWQVTAGTIIFDGAAQQTVAGLNAYDVYVENPTGIVYASDANIYNIFDLNGNPLDNNGYKTNIYANTLLVPGDNSEDKSEYQDIYVKENKTIVFDNLTIDDLDVAKNVELVLTGTEMIVTSINTTGNANIIVEGGTAENYNQLHVLGDIDLYGKKNTFLIQDNTQVMIDGNLLVYMGQFDVAPQGSLYVAGNFHKQGSAYYYFYNQGTVEIDGNINSMALKMDTEDAIFKVGGNVKFTPQSAWTITSGTVIFDGTEQQTVAGLRAHTVLLNNNSEEGVLFTSVITVSRLFEHKENVFILYDNGMKSIFPDFDNDGLQDHLDQHPMNPDDVSNS